MATDLSPTEREEREVERLINKRPAPSRKPKQRRAPKHDNRRDRIKVEDPDLAKSDKDMSLNYKSASLLSIASRLAAPKKRKKPDKKPEKEKDESEDSLDKLIEQQRQRLKGDSDYDDYSVSEDEDFSSDFLDDESSKSESLDSSILDNPDINLDRLIKKQVHDLKNKNIDDYEEYSVSDKGEDFLFDYDEEKEKGLPKVREIPDLLAQPEGLVEEQARKELEERIDDFGESLQKMAPAVAESFIAYAKKHWLGRKDIDFNEVNANFDKLEESLKDYSRKGFGFKRMKPKDIPGFIQKEWPEANDWSKRAAIISSLKDAAESFDIPGSVKFPIMSAFGNGSKTEATLKLVEEVDKEGIGDIDDFSLKGDILGRFAVLTSAYNVLSKNPVKAEDLESKTKKIYEEVTEATEEIIDIRKNLQKWLREFENYADAFSKHSISDLDLEGDRSVDDMSRSVRDFFDTPKKVVDIEKLRGSMSKIFSDYDELPPKLKSLFETSNSHSMKRAMVHKSAKYHGVIIQGHPGGPTNTPTHMHDNRYFGKEHYDSIVKCAKTLLKEDDWLSYGWTGGAEDQRLRAALDIAIHTADDNLYQSKIDTETYNMLLNRLAGWDKDSFSDTIFDTGYKRSASAMKTHYQNIVRIANDLRESNPRMSLEILKSLRSIISSEGFPPADGEKEPKVSQSVETAPASSDSVVSQDKGPSDDDIKKMKSKLDELARASDADDFVNTLKDMQSFAKKFSSTRVAAYDPWTSLDTIQLTSLKDMSDEEFDAFFEANHAKIKESAKLLDEGKDDAFAEAFGSILESAEEAAKQMKTSSTRVSIATLIRVAKEVPEAARLLMPVLAAAKKKMDKKKDKKKPSKTSLKQKDADKEPKVKGGQNHPFKSSGEKKWSKPKGKKKAPVSKKRKASIELGDIDW